MMVDNKKRPGKDLDRIDRNILNELQKRRTDLQCRVIEAVGLSPTPYLERVHRLERQDFIQGYTTLLNPYYLDASLLVFVETTLNRGAPDVFEQFNAAVQKLEEIRECHQCYLVSGDFNYLLKSLVPGMSVYRKLLGETLLRLPGVNDARTYVVGRGETEESSGHKDALRSIPGANTVCFGYIPVNSCSPSAGQHLGAVMISVNRNLESLS